MDYGALGGSIVGGAFGLLGNMYSTDETNRVNSIQNKRNRDWQSDENQKQRDYETKMWEANNAYNTPSAQMERYRQAGINPYLGGSKLGAGESSPVSAPPLSGAPFSIPMQPYRFPELGTSIANIFRANAEASNQSAQSLETAAQAAKNILDVTGDGQLAKQALEPYLKSSQGISFDNGTFMKRISSDAQLASANADLAQTNASLEKEFGKSRYERVLAKFDYEYTQSVAQIGLWSSMSKLNDSLVNLNKKELGVKAAQIRELLSREALNFMEASHYKELGLTEGQTRKWLVSKMRAEAGEANLGLIDVFADWLEKGDLREYKMSSEAQDEMLDNYQRNQSPTWNTIDRALNSGRNASETASPWLDYRSKRPKANHRTKVSYDDDNGMHYEETEDVPYYLKKR